MPTDAKVVSLERQKHEIQYLVDGADTQHNIIINQDIYDLENLIPALKARKDSEYFLIELVDIKRDEVLWYVHLVNQTLENLHANLQADLAVDWWYRPVGQAAGTGLIGVRPYGLAELSMG